MLKQSIFYVALASMALTTSCSQDDIANERVLSGKEINLSPSFKTPTRAVETTLGNLGSFWVNSFQAGEDRYMNDVEYTSTNGSVWSTTAGKFFWPVAGDLHMYCYAPKASELSGTMKIDKEAQTLTDFSPNTAAADQKDFVYAKSTGSAKKNGSTGVDIVFKHALSEITVAAKNTNTAYTVKVKGVKIGNVITKGTFTFPSITDSPASWSLSSDPNDVNDYVTSWTTAYELGDEASTMDAANVPFMILPQQLESADKASEKAYIALNAEIKMQGGVVKHNGWVYVGIDTNWEMGKKYAYTLDFSTGAGQDENGKTIISGSEIKLKVNVSNWNENSETPDFSGVVPARPTVANSVIIDPSSDKAYGINIVDKINTFWSSAAGNQTEPIANDTEWEADVIWQDIPSRAINFCNAAGVVVPGDKFVGKGKKALYVKAATDVKGNVVVGVKKKGESDYLWSWHLWLTDNPQEVSGFMDRNLGATSATATDGNKTHGLYYQFGRKDPFTGDIERYNINGTSIGKTTIECGMFSFAKAVKSPATFYSCGIFSSFDWASPNQYTGKNWNDIVESDGKTFFDPCPEGWRLPTKDEFSSFSITNFAWDSTNSGRTYNNNWFPASGYRADSDGSMHDVGSYGDYWSASPNLENNGYGLNFGSSYVQQSRNWYGRADGFSVRCVQE